jgi:tetratricopeptide (TPR) repeat protein
LDFNLKTKCLELLTDVETRLKPYDDERAVLKSMKSDCLYYKDYFNTVTIEALRLTDVFKKVDVITQDINSTQLANEKISFQQDIVNLLEDLYVKYPENEKLKNELAYAYNDLSWFNLRLGQFKKAEKIIIKAQKLEQPILLLKCNLAHSYLLQNKVTQAKRLYLELKNEKNSKNEPFRVTIMKDFKILYQDGIRHEMIEMIENLISQNLNTI